MLKPGQLSAYKDAKSFGHSVTYHGEDPLLLINASWEILTTYKKKKHVAKLRYEAQLNLRFLWSSYYLKDQFKPFVFISRQEIQSLVSSSVLMLS